MPTYALRSRVSGPQCAARRRTHHKSARRRSPHRWSATPVGRVRSKPSAVRNRFAPHGGRSRLEILTTRQAMRRLGARETRRNIGARHGGGAIDTDDSLSARRRSLWRSSCRLSLSWRGDARSSSELGTRSDVGALDAAATAARARRDGTSAHATEAARSGTTTRSELRVSRASAMSTPAELAR